MEGTADIYYICIGDDGFTSTKTAKKGGKEPKETPLPSVLDAQKKKKK